MAGGVEELGVEEADRSMAEDRSAVERSLIGFGGLKVKVAQVWRVELGWHLSHRFHHIHQLVIY